MFRMILFTIVIFVSISTICFGSSLNANDVDSDETVVDDDSRQVVAVTVTNNRVTPDMNALAMRTNFTKDELIQLYRGFEIAMPSGYMSFDNLHDILATILGYDDSRDFAQMLFRGYDTNDDGKISFEEFVDLSSIVKHGTIREKLRLTFRVLDSNKRGYIIEDDVFNFVNAVYKMVRRHISSRLISVSTIRTQCHAAFQKFDTDGDGKVSESDFIDSLEQDADMIAYMKMSENLSKQMIKI